MTGGKIDHKGNGKERADGYAKSSKTKNHCVTCVHLDLDLGVENSTQLRQISRKTPPQKRLGPKFLHGSGIARGPKKFLKLSSADEPSHASTAPIKRQASPSSSSTISRDAAGTPALETSQNLQN